MRFAFIDECFSSIEGRPYTAAIASVWEECTLAPYRSEFVRIIGNAINNEPNRVNACPTIHAAEMAKEYPDNIKLLCFETIASRSKEFNVRFYYLGYLHFAINQLCDLITATNEGDLIFVYELNLSKHRAISQAYNDWNTHYYRERIGEGNVSVTNTAGVLGRYYCDKLNYHLAVTDTASYVRNLESRATAQGPLTTFKTNILAAAEPLRNLFLFDEIIQLNRWPYDTRTGKGPIRYMHHITPSDTVDLAIQFNEFLDQLRIYWTDEHNR